MSHRPTNKKKIAKLRRALRKAGNTTPVSIDLVDWLKTRGYADTNGEAERIILAGRVKSESHVLGIAKVPQLVRGKVEDVDMVAPLVPARLRETLHVVAEGE